MNCLMRLLVTPLLLSTGVVSAQPSWDEGESFDDFREEWNAWAESLPAAHRMQPDLRDAVERFDDDRDIELSEELSEYPIFVFSDARPWGQDWEHINSVREAYQKDLDRLLGVVRRPYLGAPIPTFDDDGRSGLGLPSDWVTAHSLDSVSPLRKASIYLRADAVYLAFNGEQEKAFDRFRLLDHLRQSTLELPGKIQCLVEFAMRAMQEETMVELVKYDPDLFNDTQLAEMQSIMQGHLAADYGHVFAFQQLLTHEDWRLQFHSMEFARTNAELRNLYHLAAKTYTDGYFGELLPMVMKPELDTDVSLATLKRQISVQSRIFDAMMIDLAADPAIQRMPEINTAMVKHLSGRDASRFVPVIVDTGLWRSHLGLMHRYDYQTTNHIVVLSIYRHRALHGAWPTSLAEIDPKVLPIPAIDYYSGDPLRYTLINGEPRLWALGTDRDDDGGRPVPREEDASNLGWNWFALDEWKALSDDQRAKYDGDLRILN